MTTYSYRVFPIELVRSAFESVDKDAMPNAFMSRDFHLDNLNDAIANGFRWVRTDGNEFTGFYAVFERENVEETGGMPWCVACQSYHVEPKDARHAIELQCKARLRNPHEIL